MPAAISMGVREKIIQRRDSGESFASIARDLSLSYGAVRKIYHRYKKTGDLAPSYDRCCHSEIRKDKAIYERAVALKQAHPKWGAGLIWVELAEDYPDDQLPSQRTLQRWFQRAKVQSPVADRRPRVSVQRGKRAHEVWAIDAKDQIKLADGTGVSWLTITDEGSGAILQARVFPQQILVSSRSITSQSGTTRPDAVVGLSEADPYG